jgi:hypothetical protein
MPLTANTENAGFAFCLYASAGSGELNAVNIKPGNKVDKRIGFASFLSRHF